MPAGCVLGWNLWCGDSRAFRVSRVPGSDCAAVGVSQPAKGCVWSQSSLSNPQPSPSSCLCVAASENRHTASVCVCVGCLFLADTYTPQRAEGRGAASKQVLTGWLGANNTLQPVSHQLTLPCIPLQRVQANCSADQPVDAAPCFPPYAIAASQPQAAAGAV